jgi:hypothetical protein
MAKSKKNKNKPKLNLTVRDEQRNKLEQMAPLENRSLSNLVEVMADERWKRLAEQQGVAYAKTVAEAMDLKLDMDNPADREKLRRAILDLVAGEKNAEAKRGSLKFSRSLIATWNENVWRQRVVFSTHVLTTRKAENAARGCVSAIDANGRTIWIVDAHRDGKRFIVRADDKLTAFLEVERAIHQFAMSLVS